MFVRTCTQNHIINSLIALACLNLEIILLGMHQRKIKWIYILFRPRCIQYNNIVIAIINVS